MIYYIYKVRRKQTSIRFSRSVLTHRYLRYISWISWNGDHRPPRAGFPPVLRPVPQPAHASFFAAAPIPKAAIAAPLPLLPPGGQSKHPSNLFPRKRKHLSSLFPAQLLPAVPSVLLCPQALRACCGRSIARCPRRLLRSSHKQKMRAHGIAPRTRKSVDFSLKKTHVGTPGFHALASAARTYSLTARIHYHPFSFLLFYKGKEKENRSKFSRFEYIARTHFVRPHDVRDWPVAPRPLKQR